MNNQTNIPPLHFLKFIMVSTLIGITFMLIFAVIFSAIAGNITHYETLFPIVAFVLQLIPGVISTRLMSNRYKRSLFFIALLEGIAILLIFFLASIIFNGSIPDLKVFLKICGTAFGSCLFVIFLPSRKRVKTKRS